MRCQFIFLTHLPEVVPRPTLDYFSRILHYSLPDLLRFEISRKIQSIVPAEVGDVQPVRIEAVYLGQKMPRLDDGKLLIVAIVEAPSTKHLKVGVVVGVVADLLEVVVLAAGADALLGVHGTFQRMEWGLGISLTQKYWFVLVHASIGEEEGGVRGGGG